MMAQKTRTLALVAACAGGCFYVPTGSVTIGETPCATDCPALTCGDGQTDVAEGEECDDGNDVENDGCNNWCRLPRRVFVSSEATVGAFGGSSAADERCTTMANSAGLAGAFKAWVSDAASTPATRFDVSFRGAYLLPDDTAVAVAGWADLTDGTLAAPIKVTEHGTVVDDDGYAWTGTRPTGAATGEDCSAWTDATTGTTGSAGRITAVGASWTESKSLSCPAKWRLYCFEDPAP